MRTILYYLLILGLSCSLFGCGEVSLGDRLEVSPITTTKEILATTKKAKLSEVTAPQAIQELGKSLEKYQPQVEVIKPKNNKIYSENKVEVQLKVKDLPIFKNEEFGLGSHLNLILDNEPYQEVYNLKKPLVLKNLSPGTHTLRVFAVRPWNESFKNEGAYAQTTFHILTKTNDNNPDANLPLLTYGIPQGTYGAEPIMLDFYLNQAAQKNLNQKTQDCLIRVTVNGESFALDEWQSLYLEGFERGNNWVKLELLDREGNQIENAFNQTIRLVTYEPENKDTLAQLTTGKLSVAETRGIVDRDYQPEIAEESIVEPQRKPTVKTKVNYTPPAVVEELNPVTKEIIETREPTLETVTIPETSEEIDKPNIKAEKPKVNYTPPAVVEELNPVSEEIIETREPTSDVIPTPKTSEAVDKLEVKSAK